MFTALKTHAWAYPALEVVHIIGIALLLGNLALLEVRVFGRGAALPVKDLARLSLSLALCGFGLAAASGLLMLMLAGCNAAWFHARGSLVRLDGLARLQMLVSTVIWLSVVACGRWIAYL